MRKYELATSLNLKYRDSSQYPMTEHIELMAKCGFKNLDFNYLDMCLNPQQPFLGDNYKEWLTECRKKGDECNVKFVQAHAPCETVIDHKNYDSLLKLCIRAMEGCAILGIPWMVYHTLPDPKYRFNSDDTPLEFNKKFASDLLPYAKEYGVGLAFENTIPVFSNTGAKKSIDDIIQLVDELDNELVGVCLDVGHANLCSMIKGAEHIANQSETINKLGDRLKATHIHDNYAKNAPKSKVCFDNSIDWTISPGFDNHTTPFSGTIDWQDVIDGLDAIDYEHYFTYEAHNAVSGLPEDFVEEGIVYLRKVGERILNMSKI